MPDCYARMAGKDVIRCPKDSIGEKQAIESSFVPWGLRRTGRSNRGHRGIFEWKLISQFYYGERNHGLRYNKI